LAARSRVAEDKARESLPLMGFFALLDLIFAGFLFANAFYGAEYSFLSGLIIYPIVEMLVASMALTASFIRAYGLGTDISYSPRALDKLLNVLTLAGTFAVMMGGAVVLFMLFAFALAFGISGGLPMLVVLVGRFVRVNTILSYGGGWLGKDRHALWQSLLEAFGASVPFAALLVVFAMGSFGETTSKEALLVPAVLFLLASGLIAAIEVRRFGAHYLLPFIIAFGATALLFLPSAPSYHNQYALSVVTGSWYVSSSLSTVAGMFFGRRLEGEQP